MSSIQVVHLRDVDIAAQNVASLPVVLTIAGSDPSGGAGIEADLKTFAAHKVYGATCITALTAQNTQQVKSFEKTAESHVSDILQLVFEDFLGGDKTQLKAIKTGMLTKEAVHAIVPHIGFLRSKNVQFVIDPVMISTSGASLFAEDEMKDCIFNLLENAHVITPNYMEALSLLRIADPQGKAAKDLEIETFDDFLQFVNSLQKVLKCDNILVKGGHIPWDKATETKAKGEVSGLDIVIRDVLYESKTNTTTVFESKFKNSENTHGTGCTLSSSIASNLAKGIKLQDAIALSIDYIHKSMDSMAKLGHGNGPLNHLSVPEERSSAVIKSASSNSESLNKTTAVKFFTSHPKIASTWKRYVEHPFVQKLATNTLPYDRFLYFLKQDYYYLINYAQISSLAASVAPTYQLTLLESQAIQSIVNEIERHKEKLSRKYGIQYDSIDNIDEELKPGKACIAYCDYLLAIGKTENYVGIKTALTPCLLGYHEAGIFAKKARDTFKEGAPDLDLGVLPSKEESDVYDDWIAEYISDWYTEAYEDGSIAIDNALRREYISESRLEELVNIFARASELEVAFWDEILLEA